jgi:hypothetical protein
LAEENVESVAHDGTSMTPLSHHNPEAMPIRRAGRPLARRSHWRWSVVSAFTWCALAALTSSGCIIADPPDVQLPKKTPPLLSEAQPVVTSIVRVLFDTSATQLSFNVRVRSEDLGDQLVTQPFLNYNTDRQVSAGLAIITDPSYFDDDSRTIDAKLSMALLDVGCEQFTLLVTHSDNLIRQSELIDPADVAIITWWLDVHTSSSMPATLDSCPTSSGSGSGSTGG